METQLIIAALNALGQLAAGKIAADQTAAEERQALLAALGANQARAAEAHRQFVLAANGVEGAQE